MKHLWFVPLLMYGCRKKHARFQAALNAQEEAETQQEIDKF